MRDKFVTGVFKHKDSEHSAFFTVFTSLERDGTFTSESQLEMTQTSILKTLGLVHQNVLEPFMFSNTLMLMFKISLEILENSYRGKCELQSKNIPNETKNMV